MDTRIASRDGKKEKSRARMKLALELTGILEKSEIMKKMTGT